MAVAIYVNHKIEVVEKAGQLKEEGEPLTPLVLRLASQLSAGVRIQDRFPNPLTTCVVTLASIARTDEAVNKFMIGAITFNNPRYGSNYPFDTSESVRHAAITHIRDMKNAKQALKQLLLVCQTDSETNRLEAIESLLSIYDENNDKAISKVLERMRFDKSESVRKAVEQAVDRLKKKQDEV
jgi:hypothetical protein